MALVALEKKMSTFEDCGPTQPDAGGASAIASREASVEGGEASVVEADQATDCAGGTGQPKGRVMQGL